MASRPPAAKCASNTALGIRREAVTSWLRQREWSLGSATTTSQATVTARCSLAPRLPRSTSELRPPSKRRNAASTERAAAATASSAVAAAAVGVAGDSRSSGSVPYEPAK
eukprot:355334-Chlamydomonas_euryale.AAC.3